MLLAVKHLTRAAQRVGTYVEPELSGVTLHYSRSVKVSSRLGSLRKMRLLSARTRRQLSSRMRYTTESSEHICRFRETRNPAFHHRVIDDQPIGTGRAGAGACAADWLAGAAIMSTTVLCSINRERVNDVHTARPAADYEKLQRPVRQVPAAPFAERRCTRCTIPAIGKHYKLHVLS
ncbi:hypothetical protein EVAR_32119_1 [Eumeta japonica]|uniref:Uncharacterized protein n=1 Tax=Eumeta variegata TaxID=151549 RepID=A0A4C1V4B6_EUMVA|nr:hypothetical protein EVAR_32119_1 [Eumeta japonica]